MDEHPDFADIARRLDAILDSGDEELIVFIEDVIDEAYEAVVSNKDLPADWLLRVMTRLQAIQAKNRNSEN